MVIFMFYQFHLNFLKKQSAKREFGNPDTINWEHLREFGKISLSVVRQSF